MLDIHVSARFSPASCPPSPCLALHLRLGPRILFTFVRSCRAASKGENDCLVTSISMHCFPIHGCKVPPTAWGFPPKTTWWTPGSTILQCLAVPELGCFWQFSCDSMGFSVVWLHLRTDFVGKLENVRYGLATGWGSSKIRNATIHLCIWDLPDPDSLPLPFAPLEVGSTGTRRMAKQRCSLDGVHSRSQLPDLEAGSRRRHHINEAPQMEARRLAARTCEKDDKDIPPSMEE
ncbi:hypothetical protein QR685DRAFT_358121 [Neurospora intermedia]|uniref:Questionable protein n=1 Tax=Neurospora intermedia TaxID=5142 RepID=A0ABR3D3Y4_NEUIN